MKTLKSNTILTRLDIKHQIILFMLVMYFISSVVDVVFNIYSDKSNLKEEHFDHIIRVDTRD